MECQTDLRRPDSHELMLIGFDVAEIAYNFLESVIWSCAQEVDFGRNKLVDGKNVGHFDVQGWLGLSIQVVELINVEIRLRILHGDH